MFLTRRNLGKAVLQAGKTSNLGPVVSLQKRKPKSLKPFGHPSIQRKVDR